VVLLSWRFLFVIYQVLLQRTLFIIYYIYCYYSITKVLRLSLYTFTSLRCRKFINKIALYPCAYLVLDRLNLQLQKDNCSFYAFTETSRNTNAKYYSYSIKLKSFIETFNESAK